MTYSIVEFEENGGEAGFCSIPFSLESKCVHLFQRGGNYREMSLNMCVQFPLHVIGWLLAYVSGQDSNKSNRPQSREAKRAEYPFSETSWIGKTEVRVQTQPSLMNFSKYTGFKVDIS